MDVRPLPGVIFRHFVVRDVDSRWDVIEASTTAAFAAAARFIPSIVKRMPQGQRCFARPGLQQHIGTEEAAKQSLRGQEAQGYMAGAPGDIAQVMILPNIDSDIGTPLPASQWDSLASPQRGYSSRMVLHSFRHLAGSARLPDMSRTACLLLQTPQIVGPIPPLPAVERVLTGGSKLDRNGGENVTPCLGNPIPSLTWDKDGKPC